MSGVKLHGHFQQYDVADMYAGLYALMKSLGIVAHVELNTGLSFAEFCGVDVAQRFVVTGTVPREKGNLRVKYEDWDPYRRTIEIHPLNGLYYEYGVDLGEKDFGDHWTLPKLQIPVAGLGQYIRNVDWEHVLANPLLYPVVQPGLRLADYLRMAAQSFLKEPGRELSRIEVFFIVSGSLLLSGASAAPVGVGAP